MGKKCTNMALNTPQSLATRYTKFKGQSIVEALQRARTGLVHEGGRNGGDPVWW